MSSLSEIQTELENEELVLSTEIHSKSLHITFDKYVTADDAQVLLTNTIESANQSVDQKEIKLTPLPDVNSETRKGGLRATIRNQ